MKNSHYKNTRITVIVLSLAAIVHFMPQSALANRPSIVVKVVADELPDELNPPMYNVQAKLSENLENFALQQLNDRFPLFNWVANHKGPPANPEAILAIEFAKEPGVTWRVYLTCSLTLHGVQPVRLAICEPTLYEKGERYPSPAAVEQDVTQRGQRALTMLVEDTRLDRWREKVIRQIPLANDLLHAPAPSSILVLPLAANELQADEMSKIRAELVTQLPGAAPQNSSFELSPGGPVRGGTQDGLQECSVTKFTFNGMIFNTYVNTVADVIKNKVQKSVSVRAYYYVKRDAPAWSPNP